VVNEQIEQFKPHIIHSHHPYLLGDSALRVARQRNLPLIFTHHTMYENYTHYVPLDSKGMRRFVIRLSKEYANLCTGVIAPSRSVADVLIKRGVERPIEEIPTGVDTSFFAAGRGHKARRDLGLSEKNLVLGHLGRLAPEKNLAYLTAAAAEYVADNENAFFVIAGSGPSQDEIEGIFQQQGLENRLLIVGQKTGEDLADIYAAMDIFIFSSQSETQGMVLTEAMASGKPVIALDAPGAREVVRDGYNGRLLDAAASVNEFAQAIRLLTQHTDMLYKFSQNARKTAKKFSRETCSEKLENVYKAAEQVHAESPPLKDDDTKPWESILRRLKAEWELVSSMTTAVMDALALEDPEIGLQ
jgi:1,2-diacylglycerol 3-alpha-glucosyltransferase